MSSVVAIVPMKIPKCSHFCHAAGQRRVSIVLLSRTEDKRRLTKNVRSAAKYTFGSILTGTAIRFPRGLSRASDLAKHRYDFSFSGLKTAVARWVERFEAENAAAGADARELPSLLALAQSNDAQGVLSRGAFLALTGEVLVDVEEYKARTKRGLADILCRHSGCKTFGFEDLPADDVLRRFCAYFECTCNDVVDGRAYLAYEDLHAHWREEHPNDPWLHGENDNRWNWVQVPDFWPYSELSAPSVGKRALEAVGIPLDTPREVLDGWTREGRLFCACENPQMSLPEEMSWGTLVSMSIGLCLMIYRHS